MDSRDLDHKWYARFDEKRMVLVLFEDDEAEAHIPAKYEVCELCEGKGSHVNPSIDSNGLTAEDFADDPEFKEAYFEGRYDVPCAECHGARVVPVVDEARATPEQVKLAEKTYLEHYNDQRGRWYERELGY